MEGGGLWDAPPLWLLVVDTVYYWLYDQVRPSYPLLALCPHQAPVWQVELTSSLLGL